MCEADPDTHPQQLQGEPAIQKELELCKQFLAEAQDDVQQLQAQLATAKQTASAAANSNTCLQQQLQEARQQHSQLQQKLSNAAQIAQDQLAAANTQVSATKQQLSEAKQALIAMQKAMRELQLQQQQQGEQWAALAEESSSKHAALKAQATAGAHRREPHLVSGQQVQAGCPAWRLGQQYSHRALHVIFCTLPMVSQVP
jgi:predicted  nucleic acid-binding Zn-ribbon protein